MSNSDDLAEGTTPVRTLDWSGDCTHTLVLLEGIPGLRCESTDGARAQAAENLVAVSQLRHEHLLPPLDFWTEGASLVTHYRVPKQRLDDVLRESTLHPGAAVTMLAPLLSVLEACHSRGIVGLRLDTERIWIDASGAPLAWAHSLRVDTPSPTPHWRSTSAEVLRDADHAKALVDSLLSDNLDSLPEAVTQSLAAHRWDEAANRLIEWQQPIALSAVVDDGEPTPTTAKLQARSRRELRSAGRGPRISIHTALLDRVVKIAIGMRARLSAALSEVRRGVWIAGGVGVLAAGAAMVFVLATPTAESEHQVHSSVSDDWLTEDVATGQSGVSGQGRDSGLGGDTEPTAVGESGDSQATDDEASDDSSADGGSGSVESVVMELLLDRERCLELRDQVCLEDLIMPDTLLLTDDAMGVPQWRASGDLDVTVDEFLGDAVIVNVTGGEKPASVLAVNTEAGWKLREIWLA